MAEIDDITPMPAEPAPGCCPHCGSSWLSGKGGHARDDDAAVCAHCLGLLIREGDGWRQPTYDEAERWDTDARVIAMRALYQQDRPGPEEPA